MRGPSIPPCRRGRERPRSARELDVVPNGIPLVDGRIFAIRVVMGDVPLQLPEYVRFDVRRVDRADLRASMSLISGVGPI